VAQATESGCEHALEEELVTKMGATFPCGQAELSEAPLKIFTRMAEKLRNNKKLLCRPQQRRKKRTISVFGVQSVIREFSAKTNARGSPLTIVV
jgi:hypothetical protein